MNYQSFKNNISLTNSGTLNQQRGRFRQIGHVDLTGFVKDPSKIPSHGERVIIEERFIPFVLWFSRVYTCSSREELASLPGLTPLVRELKQIERIK